MDGQGSGSAGQRGHAAAQRAASPRATDSPASALARLGVTVSHQALNVFELIHALDQVHDHLEPMDLTNFMRLLPKMRGNLPLQIMVAMTKHPLFTADLVLNAEVRSGESTTVCLARATRTALEKHSERIRSRDAPTLTCHVTLDHNVGYVVGIAAWCQRLKLISKDASADGGAVGAQNHLAIGTAGQEYFWTGDITRLQALALASEGSWLLLRGHHMP